MKTLIARALALLFLVTATALRAQVPQILNYQGRVAVGSVNFNGSGAFKFALVNAAGTTTFWSNDGTSSAGSEPTAAVTLTVTKGLYSVLLGDTTLTNMTAIPATVFNNADVRLRVWFNDGTNGSQLLTPDQRIAAVGYAMIAGNVVDGAITSGKIAAGAVTSDHIAPGAITGDRLAAGSLDFSRLQTPASPGAGQVLTYDGTGFLWAAGGTGSGPFSLNGTSAYYNGGNVGIGTATPQTTLDIVSPQHALTMRANGPDVTFKDTANNNARGVIQSVNGDMNFFTEQYLSGTNLRALLTLRNGGNVGVGTLAPGSPLTVSTASGTHGLEHTDGFIRLATYVGGATGGAWLGTMSNDRLNFYVNNGEPSLSILANGNVAIGTSTTAAKLETRSASTAAGANAVLGYLATTTPGASSAAVKGVNDGTSAAGIGVWGEQHGNGWGVYGFSPSGIGTYGKSTDGWGVHGESTNSYGVHGYTATNIGVWGEGAGSSTGVLGTSGSYVGVRGVGSTGVSAQSNGGLYALHAVAVPGTLTPWAGWFEGNVNITGTLSKGGGSFKIDHPLDPDNKYLSHSFVESPDMMNIYNGNVTTDADGAACVTMPDWFEALNRDFRYQLTVLGQFAQAIVAEEMKDGRFTIKTDKPNVKVSWQVTGVRHDAYANAHRIPLEEMKSGKDRGLYLSPEAFGQPPEKQIGRIDAPAPPASTKGN